MVCSMGKNPQMVKKALALWLMLEEIGYHDLIRMIRSFDKNTIEALFDEGLQCLECIQPNAIEPSESEDTQVFTLAIKVDDWGMRPVIRPIGEGTSSHGAALGIYRTHNEPGEVLAHASDEVPKQSNLNPDASEFYPGQAPEETRSMFLTFPSGYPLSQEEIVYFFTSTRPGQDPVYGRIIFTTSLVIPMVLNGQVKAKFLVNSKHLWARIYVPPSPRK
ncbi:hypothetical protein CFP56_015906 [Quercus suber]|uniref:Uncharacterized protein n=1 Tax=Quercus suber TaxID=58331 RepID=A0AAW0M4V0_QUESU